MDDDAAHENGPHGGDMAEEQRPEQANGMGNHGCDTGGEESGVLMDLGSDQEGDQ